MNDVRVIAGLGEKKSNNGTQWFQQDRIYDIGGVAPALMRDKSDLLIQVGQLYGTEVEPNPQAGRVYDPSGLSPTLDTCEGGNRMPKIAVEDMSEVKPIGTLDPKRHTQQEVLSTDGIARTLDTMHDQQKIAVKNATKDGYQEVEIGGVMNISYLESKTRRGRVIDQGKVTPTLDTKCEVGVVEMKEDDGLRVSGDMQEHQRWRDDGISPTLTSSAGEGGGHVPMIQKETNIRIRKLTPKECFRLQGFPDDYFERAAEVNSDSQLYRQAGNAVTVNVIYEIAKRFE